MRNPLISVWNDVWTVLKLTDMSITFIGRPMRLIV